MDCGPSINVIMGKYYIILREMLKSALRALVKRTKVEMLYWEIVKSERFDFLKVKKLLNSMQTLLILISLTSVLRAPISIILILNAHFPFSLLILPGKKKYEETIFFF
jgi:hypothetical protein